MDGLSFFQADAWKRIDTPLGKPNLEHCLAQYLCHPHSTAAAESYTSVIAEFPYTTLLPQGFMSKEDALKAFRFHFPEADASQYVVMWQDIETFPLTLLFAIPRATYQLVEQAFSTVKWTHYLSLHLDHLLKTSKQKGEKQVWVTPLGSFVHIAVAERGNLLLSNHFNIHSTSDVLYFTAQVYNQFDLIQQQTPAYVVENQDAFNSLQKHLTHCYFQPLYAHR
jgi:hypothetical protein